MYEILRRGWGTEIGDVNIWGGGALWGILNLRDRHWGC